jgi:GLPGLI family protein
MYNNTDSPNTLNATLFINNTITIFLPKYTSQVFNNSKEEAKRTNRVTVDTDYLKIDHKNKEILSVENLAADNMIVKDDYPNLQWKVTEETKVIGQYQCVKATTSYRGRDWEAWFTPEVPLHYGPWKLQGLPGLIIEAYDTTNLYVWRVEKIDFKKDPIFDKEFSSLVKVKNTTPISKKKYLENLAEYDANLDAEMRQLMPAMGEVVNIRVGYELKYEWETK